MLGWPGPIYIVFTMAHMIMLFLPNKLLLQISRSAAARTGDDASSLHGGTFGCHSWPSCTSCSATTSRAVWVTRVSLLRWFLLFPWLLPRSCWVLCRHPESFHGTYLRASMALTFTVSSSGVLVRRLCPPAPLRGLLVLVLCTFFAAGTPLTPKFAPSAPFCWVSTADPWDAT